jgi:hypothetical protein
MNFFGLLFVLEVVVLNCLFFIGSTRRTLSFGGKEGAEDKNVLPPCTTQRAPISNISHNWTRLLACNPSALDRLPSTLLRLAAILAIS